jgi:hypothetical protein
MTIGLAAGRIFTGVLLGAMPWIVGNGLDGYGATNIGCAVAVVAAATQMHRAPWLRWVQAALAMAVFFLPFAFPADDISDRQIYCAVLIGHMLLITAIVTPRLFVQSTTERTSANDSSRSDGSKTSSVSTPPN